MNVICERDDAAVVGRLLVRAQAAWGSIQAGRRVVVLFSMSKQHDPIGGRALAELCSWLHSAVGCGKVEVLPLAGYCPEPLPEGTTLARLDWILMLEIFSPLLRDWLAIPDLLAESVSLISLGAASLCSTHAVRGPLLAKAALLRPPAPAQCLGDEIELACEAERLAPSALSLAFVGTAKSAEDSAYCCWLAGSSDTAVDLALLRAAGLAPADSPCLRLLGRGRVADGTALEIAGNLPALTPSKSLPGLVPLRAAAAAVARARRRLVRDVQLGRMNLYRIRPFVRNRLQRVWGANAR